MKKEVEQFLIDYMELCLKYGLVVTSCCGKPFLKDVRDEESLKRFMDGLRNESD